MVVLPVVLFFIYNKYICDDDSSTEAMMVPRMGAATGAKHKTPYDKKRGGEKRRRKKKKKGLIIK